MSTMTVPGWPALVVALCMLGSYAIRKFTPGARWLHEPFGAFLVALASALLTSIAQAVTAHGLSTSTLIAAAIGAITSAVASANPSGAASSSILRALLPIAILGSLAGGCATAQQAGTIAADTLLGVSKATRATAAALPKSARTATVTADLVHLGVALQAAAAVVPASCAATPTAAFLAADQSAMDAFALLLRDLDPVPTPHTGAVAHARTVEDLRQLAYHVIVHLLVEPHTHAAMSTGDITGIIAAIVGGIAALAPAGVAIYNAAHTPGTPDACAAAAKALQDDVATLPAALAAP